MNGFGEHNIQGIGDKHVPLIHNVMNTDVVVGVSDRATDTLLTLFNTDEGRRYLVERRGVDPALVAELGAFGLSSICNIVAAVKLAKYFDLGPGRRRAHRRDRRRGDVRQRSAQGDRALFRQPLRRGQRRRDLGPVRWPARASTMCWNSATSTASGSSTSATSPGSSSRACRSRISGARAPVVLGRPARSRAGVGRDDRRSSTRRAASPPGCRDRRRDAAARSSATAAARSSTPPRAFPFACPERPRGRRHRPCAGRPGRRRRDARRRRRGQSVPALPALAVALSARARRRPFGRRLGRPRRRTRRAR